MKALKIAVIAAALGSASIPAEAVTFLYTGALATYVVPASRWYELTVLGAQGGAYDFNLGGFGASITANFFLYANTELTVVVGGQGFVAGGDTAAGGGGMSFVSDGMTPLVVAGGGGGAAWRNAPGGGGQIGTDGQGIFGGVNGSGGTNAASGAGWNSDGAYNEPSAFFGAGGRSWPTFAGGAPNNGESPISQAPGPGGFGGGGGGGYSCGGGGGGYSGGSGGYQSAAQSFCGGGGGGGSFTSPDAKNVVAIAGKSIAYVPDGNPFPEIGPYDGFVSIEFASAVPEPSTWAMLILGFGLSGAMLRRKRKPATAALMK